MKADLIIIQRADAQKPLQRLTFAVITMLAWVLWVSLWLPVITLLAWLLGLAGVYARLGPVPSMQSASDLGYIFTLGLASALAFSSWSIYNRVRFFGKQRRQDNLLVGNVAIARSIGASIGTARRLQASRRAVIHFDDDGRMILAAKHEVLESSAFTNP